MSYDKSHHLEWIEIESFKCFDKLRVEGLERVNLIGGDNNVGKTAFMEACYLELMKDKNFHKANVDIHFYINFVNMKEVSNFREYEISSKNFLSNLQIEETKKHMLKRYDYDDNILNINFIPVYALNDNLLAKFFDIIQFEKEEKEEEYLNRLIKEVFDNRFEKFKFSVSDKKPKIYVKDEKEYRNLEEFGDGLKRFITIICAIWASRDGALFIDEIENGIHYTKLPKLWEIIFKTSKEANCQVFATTHSKETIEAFNKMQFKEDGGETTYFEFARYRGGDKIFASKINRDRLKYGLTHNEPLRGETEVPQ